MILNSNYKMETTWKIIQTETGTKMTDWEFSD
jgi:hypothetical protein